MKRPVLLDLFCKAGGCTKGYQRAGFYVVGVDVAPQPRYCGDEFIQADAMEVLQNLADFDHRYDAIHASPPCQRFSVLTPKRNKDDHLDLIAATRAALELTGLPFVIENVPGARKELRDPIMLCGSMFGLRCRRHRLFEIEPMIYSLLPACDHSQPPLLVTTAGRNSRAIRRPGEYKSVKNAPAAYGIDWMSHAELCEAIPPAYTEWIGRRIMEAAVDVPQRTN